MSVILGVLTEVRNIIAVAVYSQQAMLADHTVNMGQHIWQVPRSEVVVPLRHKMKQNWGGDKPRPSFFTILSPFTLS
ncbi:MAG: hypothetical protein WBH01_04930 [Dehalococcoidia bacterium]